MTLSLLCSVGAINFGFIESSDTKYLGTKIVIAMGSITLANAFFNCFVLCKHPAFQEGGVTSTGTNKLSDAVRARCRAMAVDGVAATQLCVSAC